MSASVVTPAWRPRVNPWIIAVAVMLATFMELLDTTVTNVALPHIAGNLSASVDEATWVLTSYLVSNAIILPASGWLSQFFGRKRFLMACVGIFTLASVLCGLAPNLGLLVVARVLQGVGGGALQPLALAILMESFPQEQRGVAGAVYGIGILVAPIVGPTLGGWLTDNYSWRWIFFINLPVGALSLLMTQLFIEDPPYIKAGAPGRIDYLGFGLMALGLGSLQIALDKGQEEDWFASAWICWLAVIAAVALIAFVYHELRTREPIVNLRVFANRNFATGTVLFTVLGVALYGIIVLVPLYLQNLMGYPALQSGLTISPRGLAGLLTLLIISRLIAKVDSRWLIAGGFVALSVSSFLLSSLNLDISMGNIVVANLLGGVALGCIFVPLTNIAMGTLRNEDMGNASGIFNLMRNIGASVGISLLATMLARASQAHQALLVGHLNPFDPNFQARLQATQSLFAQRTDIVTAAEQAQHALYGLLVQQSTLLAFIDCFQYLGFLCLLCLPLVLLFRKVQAPGRPTPAH